MVIPLLAILVGLVIGLVRGGRIRHLARIRPRWPLVGVVGLVGIAYTRFGWMDAPEIVLATSLVLCLTFCLANLRLRGLGVVAVGLAANLLPLLVNGFVPVDPDALVHADVVSVDALETVDLPGGHALADDDTVLAVLGERIPIPELHLVVSFGDLIIAAGLGAAARNAVRHRRTRGVPVQEILAADDELIDLTPFDARTGRRRQHPVEVSPGEPVPIPMGWGPVDDDLVGVGGGSNRAASPRSQARNASPHVPWPWRRTPPPRPDHPTMRVSHR